MSTVHPTHPDKGGLPKEVIAALRRGAKIEAIKLLRTARRIGLKEAKEEVETYLRGDCADLPVKNGELPTEVITALRSGDRIEAVKRLRRLQQTGLKEAKDQIDAYQRSHPGIAGKTGKKNLFLVLVLFATFGWALVTSVEAIGSLIVLAHLDGYRKQIFTIEKLHYSRDSEGGLSWGFEGRIAGRKARLYAPSLAGDGKPTYARLKKRFPPGTKIASWYNLDVTDTLFQGRTLRVIPFTPDLKNAELERFMRWVLRGLLPFLLILLLAVRLKER